MEDPSWEQTLLEAPCPTPQNGLLMHHFGARLLRPNYIIFPNRDPYGFLLSAVKKSRAAVLYIRGGDDDISILVVSLHVGTLS